MWSTPREEIERRIQALQSGMREQGMEAALIVQRADLFYFSGTGQEAYLLIPAEGRAALLVRKSLERAEAESPLDEVHPSPGLSALKQHVESVCGGKPRTLGMELDVLPVNLFRMYQDLFPDTEIRDVSYLVREVRMIKSAYELDLIREAGRLNDSMFGMVREILTEGMSEVEFSGLLEAYYRKHGHQGYVRVRSFNQEVFYGHVMSGPNLAIPSATVGPTGGPGVHPSMPHGAGLKTIRRHEPVSIDYVGVARGYMVDQARTFFLGEPPEKFLQVHEVALEIQNTLAAHGCAGTRAETLYDTAVDMAAQAGFTEGFLGYPQSVPFVGHGVGLELDELPVVGRKSPHVLQEGMVVALEPKFILPGEGLAGIENTFVVTRTGLERITTFDDAIQVL
ncbi:MAG: aminopeptidase P family protein [Desulfomonile tiedjei]|nr:aminopeptidase P family protein [Desulfomonile tiedjei]